MAEPFHQDEQFTLLEGDCRQTLQTLPDQSVQCCVTSPPYWGLRDYGHGEQIGLEQTPEAYVAEMVAVFRHVRRVLRDDGTLWLNLGDSYAANTKQSGRNDHDRPHNGEPRGTYDAGSAGTKTKLRVGLGTLKPKDLVGIPWRVAFALQADGWYLRQDIIWSKPNPMPESVTDRCTKAHEYVFLLSKNERYFYDAEAVKEKASGRACGNKPSGKSGAPQQGLEIRNFAAVAEKEYHDRNRRSVWHIATKPYSGAHFATFPPALITPCILAGTSAKGCCSKCGAPWERVLKTDGLLQHHWKPGTQNKIETAQGRHGATSVMNTGCIATKTTTGWQPSCDCDAEAVPCVVLDPFNGAGTTGVVSRDHGRRYIGCELNPEYAELSRRRWAGLTPEEPDDDPEEHTRPRQGQLAFDGND